MKSNYVITNIDDLIDTLKKAKEMHPDRIFVTGVTGSGSVNAPTKRKKSYSFNLEQLFSPDLFISNGVTALLDGGGIYLAHIPKKHIKPELLKGE